MNRYLSFHDYFYQLFGEKALKLSIDAGFTCPNRDGTISNKGCVFCSEKGAGDFTNRLEDIHEQMDLQRQLLCKKWPDGINIAYFQNFTNTYKSPDKLREIYDKALSYPNTKGLAIATRADCLDEDVLDLLEEYNKKTFLWLELGLQSIKEETIKTINRGYSHEYFHRKAKELKKRNLRAVCHVIFGLAGEDEEDMMRTVDYVGDMEFFGVKFHSLYIQSDSPMSKNHQMTPYNFLSKEEYIDLVVKGIELISPKTVVHRLTGDPDRAKLIGPAWTLDKLSVISSIEKTLKDRDSFQAKRFKRI